MTADAGTTGSSVAPRRSAGSRVTSRRKTDGPIANGCKQLPVNDEPPIRNGWVTKTIFLVNTGSDLCVCVSVVACEGFAREDDLRTVRGELLDDLNLWIHHVPVGFQVETRFFVAIRRR